MKKITLFILLVVMSGSIYAADQQLTSGDLNCLQQQKHQGKIITCLPTKKPDNCSPENYQKLKTTVQECSFKIRGALRSAL
ncbi:MULTISPECIES: hypothetical protein [Francisella]|uniref:Uncharacterized protein n=1 Tax=Francisella opportunistica TaxID=2016517 RepID=A0A345JQU1_9GAMM|nr:MULTISPECIES: hypothetical protein [Francisella]APC91396.1 hypothetical protein BBG19_0660 [Francisella sp. MA067296]AXH29687.1 hypothetical protein CGC43_03380 [Francisella opportunistica]AXH31337.1 hypothetical protein CGC44_03350 [Francisella opportunistica]AXH32983.1 hypothetical protein CGC45_03370 [Francisella opportunistica]